MTTIDTATLRDWQRQRLDITLVDTLLQGGVVVRHLKRAAVYHAGTLPRGADGSSVSGSEWLGLNAGWV